MEKYIRLNDGHVMPMIGFGTYQMPCRITQHCVEQALEIGYRHIDTAQCYGNEHFAPANIAEKYWQMYQERKDWEVRYE